MTLAADMHRAHGVAEKVITDSTIRAHWFKTPNPELGNRSPRGLIRTGEVEAVITLLGLYQRRQRDYRLSIGTDWANTKEPA